MVVHTIDSAHIFEKFELAYVTNQVSLSRSQYRGTIKPEYIDQTSSCLSIKIEVIRGMELLSLRKWKVWEVNKSKPVTTC